MAVVYRPNYKNIKKSMKKLQCFDSIDDFLNSIAPHWEKIYDVAKFHIYDNEQGVEEDQRIGWTHVREVMLNGRRVGEVWTPSIIIGYCDTNTFADDTKKEAREKTLEAYHGWLEESR